MKNFSYANDPIVENYDSTNFFATRRSKIIVENNLYILRIHFVCTQMYHKNGSKKESKESSKEENNKETQIVLLLIRTLCIT